MKISLAIFVLFFLQKKILPFRSFIKITLLFLASFVLFCGNANAQNKMVDSLIDWTNKHPKIDSQYIQTLHRISYRLSESDVKKSFDYYEKVSAYSDSLHFTFGKSLAQINLGILLSTSGNFEASNNAYFKAIDEAEACGAVRLKAVSLNNIGDNYKILKDYPKCRDYIVQAIPLNKQLKTWRGVAINYELLYQCDFAEKLYTDAKKDLDTGMLFANKANENYIYSQYYLDLGKLEEINNQSSSATYYFAKALNEAKQESDLKNESEVYLAQSQYLKDIPLRKKIIFLDSALQIAKRIGYVEGVANSAKQLSMSYDELKNKDSSMAYYVMYRMASDTLFSEKNRNVIIKESEWLIKRKEVENQNLKQLASFQSREIRNKNGLLLAVIISLGLTFIVAFFIYKSFQSRKKQKEFDLKRKISEMEMQMLRAQMNPHFIFNSLNSINRFILQNNKAQASEYLTKFSKLVRLILQNSQTPLISLESELEALALYLDMESLRFNFHFNYKIFVPDDVEISSIKVPPLILQPYAENAIWHGLMHKEEKGLLDIDVMQQNGYLYFKITDDGIGRKQAEAFASKSATKHKSMGLRITADRIAMLRNAKPNETAVTIHDLMHGDGSAAGTEIVIKIPVIYDESNPN